MNLTDFKMVYIDINYLATLHDADKEVMYDPEGNYNKKPHLGILVNNDGYQYVIPLTSAKEKHRNWKDVGPTNFRVYEIIDIRNTPVDENDILLSVGEFKLDKMEVPEEERQFYQKRLLSVLEIKKMFPVIDGVYTIIDLDQPSKDSDEEKRRILMRKEYLFCRRIIKEIEQKADTIYNKQVVTGVIKRYHCNYRLLEGIANSYKVTKRSGN